jgi:hypothetical protein
MHRYFFSMSDGRKTIRDSVGTELDNFSEVQREALDFAMKVLKHRFTYGIDDPSRCAVQVSNEIGRVLTRIPLSEIKRCRSAA